ncbi:hypothetical protein HJG53_07325 [Sphingomonas sp. ID1715]|nr:hypothetical protein [Sphingomonas sp. ID1715]
MPARLRGDDGWSDVCIRNVSSHGMMLVMHQPPPRGTYIEVRRGSAAVTGRVMWVRAGRCGLRTKERISVAALTMATAQNDNAEGLTVERRAQARVHHPDASAARAVYMARTMQFGTALALIAAAAGFAAHKTYGVLSAPSTIIAGALG